MRHLRSLVLYAGLVLGANAALADTAALEALREGTMKKLSFHAEGRPVSDAAFFGPEGEEHRLSDWQGKHVLVNFWATWCAPCRKEMPMLEALQKDYAGEDFEVVTIATSRSQLPAVRKFFADIEVEALPILLDPDQSLAREMGVLGLPITLLLNPEGEEIARLQGDAEWDGESARAIIEALLPESTETAPE